MLPWNLTSGQETLLLLLVACTTSGSGKVRAFEAFFVFGTKSIEIKLKAASDHSFALGHFSSHLILLVELLQEANGSHLAATVCELSPRHPWWNLCEISENWTFTSMKNSELINASAQSTKSYVLLGKGESRIDIPTKGTAWAWFSTALGDLHWFETLESKLRCWPQSWASQTDSDLCKCDRGQTQPQSRYMEKSRRVPSKKLNMLAIQRDFSGNMSSTMSCGFMEIRFWDSESSISTITSQKMLKMFRDDIPYSTSQS